MSIKPVAFHQAMTDPSPVVDRMIAVKAVTVPIDVRVDAQRRLASPEVVRSWTEVYAPLSSQGGCRYGCKLFAMPWGFGLRYAVLHSSSYGHPKR